MVKIRSVWMMEGEFIAFKYVFIDFAVPNLIIIQNHKLKHAK